MSRDRFAVLRLVGGGRILNGVSALALAMAALGPPAALEAQFLGASAMNQDSAARLEQYYAALEHLSAEDIAAAAVGFAKLDTASLESLTQRELYNGAFVFALDNQSERAFRWLEALVRFHRFDDAARLAGDADFGSLHNDARWDALIAQAKANREARDTWLPVRIADRLSAAKAQIEDGSPAFWGMTFWDDHILVLVGDGTAYTPLALEDAQEAHSGLYRVELSPNEVSFGNTVQDFRGTRFVTIMRP